MHCRCPNERNFCQKSCRFSITLSFQEWKQSEVKYIYLKTRRCVCWFEAGGGWCCHELYEAGLKVRGLLHKCLHHCCGISIGGIVLSALCLVSEFPLEKIFFISNEKLETEYEWTGHLYYSH